MLRDMRSRFGPMIVSGIIGLIAFVFVFSGVFSPGPFSAGGVAGSVNGVPISQADFSRALNQRMSMFKGMNFTPKQLKQFGVYDGVFRDLVNRQLMIQEGERSGVIISDEELRNAVRGIPVFQEAGKFDRKKYQDILKANGMNPGGFEKKIREDLLVQYWQNFFSNAVQVTADEILREFKLKENKRDLQYVLLNTQIAEKKIKINAEKIQKFLKHPKKKKQVEVYFNDRVKTQYKGKKLSEVEKRIAENLIREEERKSIMDRYLKLGQKIAKKLNGKKSSEKQINAMLRKTGGKVEYSGMIDVKTKYLPKLGYANEMLKDAFEIPSPIYLKDGGRAKTYQVAKGIVVAALAKREVADLNKFKGKKEIEIKRALLNKKEKTIFQQWLSELNKVAKILKNEKILQDGA